MRIGTFIREKIRNFFLLSIFVVSIAFIVNLISDNWLLARLGEVQQNKTLMEYNCSKTFDILDGVLTLKDFTFEIGDGSCVKKLEKKNITHLVIDGVNGGDITETRIFAKYIQKNKIPAVIKGYCNSSCLDLYLHSPNRSFCLNGGSLGVHSYKNNSYQENLFMTWLRKSTENSMLRAYYDTKINTDFIKELYKSTPSDDLYQVSISEMRDNFFTHRFLNCN